MRLNFGAQPVPDIKIELLNVVIPVMLEDAVNVIVAAVDCPADSTVLCLFHVTVKGPLAVVGLQLLVAILIVKEAVP